MNVLLCGIFVNFSVFQILPGGKRTMRFVFALKLLFKDRKEPSLGNITHIVGSLVRSDPKMEHTLLPFYIPSFPKGLYMTIG